MLELSEACFLSNEVSAVESDGLALDTDPPEPSDARLFAILVRLWICLALLRSRLPPLRSNTCLRDGILLRWGGTNKCGTELSSVRETISSECELDGRGRNGACRRVRLVRRLAYAFRAAFVDVGRTGADSGDSHWESVSLVSVNWYSCVWCDRGRLYENKAIRFTDVSPRDRCRVGCGVERAGGVDKSGPCGVDRTPDRICGRMSTCDL